MMTAEKIIGKLKCLFIILIKIIRQSKSFFFCSNILEHVTLNVHCLSFFRTLFTFGVNRLCVLKFRCAFIYCFVCPNCILTSNLFIWNRKMITLPISSVLDWSLAPATVQHRQVTFDRKICPAQKRSQWCDVIK